MKSLIFLLITFLSLMAEARGVREVSGSSCRPIQINLGLGLTTQLIFEQEPKVTLFADKTHFKIVTNPSSPRSVAIIPNVDPSELERLKGRSIARVLDQNLKTNLFIIFAGSNQLMFDLRFVDKAKADYVVKVNQTFPEDCVL